MFAGAAKKLNVQNSDDTDSSLDWATNGVLELDEIKTTESSRGKAKKKATKARARSTGTL